MHPPFEKVPEGAFSFLISLTKYDGKCIIKRSSIARRCVAVHIPSDDDFWDLGKLVPKKKRPTLESFIPSPTLADVSTDGRAPVRSDRTLHIIHTCEKAESYCVADNLFLQDVTLEIHSEAYNLYHRFMDDAKRYFGETGEEVPYVRYFSYMPQYAQLTAQQLAYYLYWRSQLLAGIALTCDEGYLYLFAYECINLTEALLPPKEALERLLTLWQNYAQQFPKINKYLSEWISDLCLIYRITLPHDRLGGLLPIIYRLASFPEFYFGAVGDVTLSNSDLLLALLCDYDYRSSRCYTAVPTEAAKDFAATMEHSMFGVFHEIFSGGTIALRSEETKAISHIAFCGALYAKEQRVRLTVRYAPIADAAEIRTIVSAAVKYSENLYRALHGNRNRLAVQALPERYRAILDAYYRVFFRRKEKAKIAASEPAYMAQYAPAERGVTLSRADEIESLSWENTQRLVPGEEIPEEPQETLNSSITGATELICTPSDAAVDYLRCVLYGDTVAIAGYASQADRLAERINQIFLEEPEVGDIVLEPTEGGYKLVDDYQSEVEKWIQNR